MINLGFTLLVATTMYAAAILQPCKIDEIMLMFAKIAPSRRNPCICITQVTCVVLVVNRTDYGQGLYVISYLGLIDI